MDGVEYASLVEDIRVRGLREPIVLFEGRILDGRNRYRACRDARVEVRSTAYEGDDPVAYVVSTNLRRRHLDESQRAMVAAKLANLQVGRPPENSPIGGISQDLAAKLLNVGKRSVERAREVQDQGALELQRAVERGDVSVSAAAEIAAVVPKEEQPALVERGAKEIRRRAKQSRTTKTV